MTNQPKLLAVPHFLQELTIKADLNGVTVLKDGRFRKRYTGSKQFAVDINGNLHRSAELKKILDGTKQPVKKIKKGPVTKPTPTNLTESKDNENSNVPRPRGYTINKPEIRQRIFAKIAQQPAQKKELYFWTVTFPQRTQDAVAYKLFNVWLTKLRQKKLLTDYIWIAERQTGERLQDKTKQPTNTIHFHLAIPHKMNAKVANREMMVCLCTASKNGEIDYSVYACKRYNGVDIAKNRNTKKVTNFALGKKGRRALTTYITKYVTKNNSELPHLAWHNSRGFSSLFTGVTFTVDEFVNIYKLVDHVRRYSAINNDFFQYHPWKNGPPPGIEGELLKLNSYIQNFN